MIKLEYALITKSVELLTSQGISQFETLSIVSFHGEKGVPVESRVFLSIEGNEYTYLYCCNNKSYRCLTSALIFENHLVNL